MLDLPQQQRVSHNCRDSKQNQNNRLNQERPEDESNSSMSGLDTNIRPGQTFEKITPKTLWRTRLADCVQSPIYVTHQEYATCTYPLHVADRIIFSSLNKLSVDQTQRFAGHKIYKIFAPVETFQKVTNTHDYLWFEWIAGLSLRTIKLFSRSYYQQIENCPKYFIVFFPAEMSKLRLINIYPIV